jgi:hypothetical protein
MDLSQAKLGDQYRIFVDSSGNILPSPSMNTLVATVIATKKPGYGTDIILGWMTKEESPSNARDRNQPSLENDYVPNQALYKRGITVKRIMQVAIKIINGLDGFPCKRCTNFFPYALPNQSDGTLICWSCRNTR